jgi:hypothetical protein
LNFNTALPPRELHYKLSTSEISLPSTSTVSVGRPIKPFIQSSDKTKRRKRLLESLDISDQNLNEFKNLYLHFKWGCNGSSGHSEYHQKFIETKVESGTVSINKKCDGNIFLFSLIPLEFIESKNNSDFKSVLWKNQTYQIMSAN